MVVVAFEELASGSDGRPKEGGERLGLGVDFAWKGEERVDCGGGSGEDGDNLEVAFRLGGVLRIEDSRLNL